MNRIKMNLRASFLVTFVLFFAVAGLAAESGEAGAATEVFDWRAFLAPFHTVTLHMPIGFVMIALILELYYFVRPSDALRGAIGLVLVFSAFSAVLVALLGILRASDGGYDPEMLEMHRRFGIAVAAATVLALILHIAAFYRKKRSVLAFFYRLALLGDMILLVIAGHGGGNLTHGSTYLTENAPAWVQNWMELSGGLHEVPETDEASDFTEIIQPIFKEKCYQCHGPEKQKGGYRMDTVEGLFKAGDSEIDPIVKNRALESYLVELITLPADDDFAMPPVGKERLTPEETVAIIEWIWNGAETGASPSAE